MSHMAKIELEITDMGSLQAACEHLGWTLMENQRTYNWFGKYMNDYPLPEGVNKNDLGKCDHAIRVPGASYEIGVIKQKGGSFTILYDFWKSGGLVQKLGIDGGPLKQEYAAQKTLKAAKKKGLKLKSRTLTEDGKIRLHLRA